MENNITDSGSRVTRSLRKRIASVDSDNSSRSGTPIGPKLSSITEISASPSRSTRTSRRNSISSTATPVKTPAKRAIGASSVITENSEISTPARRSTRRRSISANESEETPQSSLKVPSFPALTEELLPIEKMSPNPEGTSRSPSKSPQKTKETSETPLNSNCSNEVEKINIENRGSNNSSKRRKPGPKCKTRRGDETDDASDVEISIMGKGIDELKSKSTNIPTITLTNDDSNLISSANMEIVEREEENNIEGDNTVNITNMPGIIAEKSNSCELKDDGFEQTGNKGENLEKSMGFEELSKELPNSDESDKQNESYTKPQSKILPNVSTLVEKVIVSTEDSQKGDDARDSCSKKIGESMMDIAGMNCMVLEEDAREKTKVEDMLNTSVDNISTKNMKQYDTPQKEKASGNKIEITEICTLTSYKDMDKISSKTVDFVPNLNSDMNNKNVYPKTPVPTKAKSRLHSHDSFPASCDVFDEQLCQVEKISSNAVNIDDAKTTPRGSNNSVRNLQKVQSSTPINVETLTCVSPPEINQTLIKHVKVQNDECVNTQVEKVNLKYTAAETDSVEDETPMKWINPSVRGESMKGSKLDVMSFTENKNVSEEMCDIENESSNSQKHENSEDDELDSVGNEYEKEHDFINDEDEEEELTAIDKNHEGEHDFLDDEAMAVDDYESGDSMDSEERKEMLDNEIPVDGESIGSHTTDDENDECTEEENSENEDSFIVSDNEDGQFLESSDGNAQTDKNEDDDHHNKKKKKFYKRLQCPTESSSSDDEKEKYHPDDETTKENVIAKYQNEGSENDNVAEHDISKHSEKSSKPSDNVNNEEVIEENQSETNFECNTYTKHDDNLLDSSKLSDSALRLQHTVESETEEQKADKLSDTALRLKYTAESETEEQEADKLSDSALRLQYNAGSETEEQKTDKLTDSALRLQYTAETETVERETEKEITGVSRKKILRNLNYSDRLNKSVRDLNLEIEMSSAEDMQSHSTFDFIEINSDTNNIKIFKEGRVSKSSGENGVQKELNYYDNKVENNLGEVSITTESDDDKENGCEIKSISKSKKLESSLSTSFDSNKTLYEKNMKAIEERQHSYSADMVSKSEGSHPNSAEIISKDISMSISSPSSTQKYLETICHAPLPLGNPLIRTRRQSLALPTNPDMEICSSYGSGVSNIKPKRKSLGILPNTDFNPSQSLIDTIELQKSYNNRQVFKRKRMSKSFCGTSETLDNSLIDVDVQHLNKRTKIVCEKSIDESSNNTNEKVKAGKLLTKIGSTLCQKGIKNDSKFNIQTILHRCDEILEAANQAKLEAKTHCKKRKAKLSNKQRKSVFVSSLETNQDDVLRRTSKESNRKGKTKTAVTHAIKAAEKILNKRRLENEIKLKRLPSEVLEVIEKFDKKKNSNKKAIDNKQKKEPCYHTTVTAIGSFVEIPQTPKKKNKELTYIQLPTGKVSVEPVTPIKRSVQACNGTEFRESPVTPYPTGFKVREIHSVANNSPVRKGKVAKRKRHSDEDFKQNTLPKPQWTQSGPFIEEEIPIMNQVYSAGKLQKSKKSSVGDGYSKEVGLNFKQKAMMRSDIKRSTNREVMLLREHRHAQCRY